MFTGSGNSWAAINDADSVRGKLWLVSVILTHSLIIQYIINIVTEWSVIQPHILWSATQIITRPVCHHESFQDWSEQTAVDRIECTWNKKKRKWERRQHSPTENTAPPVSNEDGIVQPIHFDGGQLEKAPSAHYLVQSPHVSSQAWNHVWSGQRVHTLRFISSHLWLSCLSVTTTCVSSTETSVHVPDVHCVLHQKCQNKPPDRVNEGMFCLNWL